MILNDTIVALSTPQGSGAIGVIRLSGAEAINIAGQISSIKNINEKPSHSLHYCNIINDNKIIDEVVIAIFKNPTSYTGENVVEISCHGSSFVIQQIIDTCITQDARLATAGEFTQRAFINGKLNLSEAEAVGDLIASENEAQHKLAIQQLRGGYSKELQEMREQLINFAALIELELDFSGEDVTFADRAALENLLIELHLKLTHLSHSFKYGNAIKKGIPVTIVGKPNAGKSTLLNTLLNDDKAIVSEIAGTTRDTIEDTININGLTYRFIDTAGLRQTDDVIENLGIEKTLQKVKLADIILLLCDVNDGVENIIDQYKALDIQTNQELIFLINKIDATNTCDAYDIEEAVSTLTNKKALAISAKTKLHTHKIADLLSQSIQKFTTGQSDIIVSNIRHYNAINETLKSIVEIQTGMQNNLSGDLLTIDIRRALKHLGSITGVVEIDRDILGAIFGKFCIGK